MSDGLCLSVSGNPGGEAENGDIEEFRKQLDSDRWFQRLQEQLFSLGDTPWDILWQGTC